eukprot:COSAG06_NODE_2918_length_6095_cov_510.475150_8_plen_70_part_00
MRRAEKRFFHYEMSFISSKNASSFYQDRLGTNVYRGKQQHSNAITRPFFLLRMVGLGGGAVLLLFMLHR